MRVGTFLIALIPILLFFRAHYAPHQASPASSAQLRTADDSAPAYVEMRRAIPPEEQQEADTEEEPIPLHLVYWQGEREIKIAEEQERLAVQWEKLEEARAALKEGEKWVKTHKEQLMKEKAQLERKRKASKKIFEALIRNATVECPALSRYLEEQKIKVPTATPVPPATGEAKSTKSSGKASAATELTPGKLATVVGGPVVDNAVTETPADTSMDGDSREDEVDTGGEEDDTADESCECNFAGRDAWSVGSEEERQLLDAVKDTRFYLLTEAAQAMQTEQHFCDSMVNSTEWEWTSVARKNRTQGEGEAAFTALLRRSPYRTMDLAAADLVVIPAWPTCLGASGAKLSNWMHTQWPDFAARPRRYLLLQESTANGLYLGSLFTNATVLHYEVVRPWDRSGKTWGRPSASTMKDIAVPDWATTSFLYALSDSFLQRRDRPYTFMGSYDARHNSYTGLRRHLTALFVDSPELNAIVAPDFGTRTDHRVYMQRATESVFCVAARGHTITTRTLWNSLAAGCIPIIVSDMLQLPFSSHVPWADMVIFVPEQQVLVSGDDASLQPMSADFSVEGARDEIRQQLLRLVHDTQLQDFMRANILRHRRKFFYGLGRPESFGYAEPSDHATPFSIENDKYWADESLLVPSVLNEAKQLLIDGSPAPQARRTTLLPLKSLREQIDRLVQASRDPPATSQLSSLSSLI